LETNGANEDFLSFWNSKAGKRSDPNYPQPAQRAGLLRLRLKEMRDSLQYFEFGSRLMHFGRYREAIDFFREFQRQFPGRELFNNIGYCHLRIAIGQLDPDYAYRYWLPMVSDLDTALANLTVRSAEFSGDRKQWRMSAAARESLLQAARYFERAIDKDAAYAPSYINLATTQLLLGLDPGDTRLQIADGNNLLRAKMAITSALKIRPDDSQTKVLAAIIDFESQMENPSNRSLALPANLDANDPTALYNLAQLTSFDAAKSARYWQQLVNQFESLPRKMQATICRRHNRANIPSIKSQCESVANNSVNAKVPWALPIKLSRDLLEVPLTESELRQNAWKKTSLGSGVAFVGSANAALAVDDIVTLVVLRPPSTAAESLVQCCSQPADKIPVVNGVLWHYGRWIALVREQRVEEIWFSN
jgi:tetratricopeptide (TPR) repeat protein